ncbi:MAG TPA: RNA methyltransferase [Anaerolineales bacterium]|nr:RNA methyltransferase [Anaerolineales bacterium]
MISSAHNAKVQLARALLGRSKERREAGAFVAEGVRLVEEARAAAWPFRFALAGETLGERGIRLVDELQAGGIDVERVTDALLGSLSGTETSQGILAVLENRPLPLAKSSDFVLIADQVRDPGNLGTLLRTAAAAGVQAVLLPPETTDAFAPKVVRAGMGAHFRLPIRSLDWDGIRSQVAGLQVYLAEMEGALSCWQADFTGPLALIVGGEAEGASPTARALAAKQVFIPMPGKTESLNAGIAGAILLFEVVRQRKKS